MRRLFFAPATGLIGGSRSLNRACASARAHTKERQGRRLSPLPCRIRRRSRLHVSGKSAHKIEKFKWSVVKLSEKSFPPEKPRSSESEESKVKWLRLSEAIRVRVSIRIS